MILCLILDIRYLKRLSASGGLRPLTPTRGSAPGPRWGLRPQTPLYGERGKVIAPNSAHVIHASFIRETESICLKGEQ